MITGVNGYIAVEPFKDSGAKIKVEHGVAWLTQKHELIPLKVVHGNYNPSSINNPNPYFQPGGTVWVDGEVSKHAQSRKIFQEPGGPFILLQVNLIQLYESPPYTRPEPTSMSGSGRIG